MLALGIRINMQFTIYNFPNGEWRMVNYALIRDMCKLVRLFMLSH